MAACCATAPTPMNDLTGGGRRPRHQSPERIEARMLGVAVLGQRRPPPAPSARGEVVARVAPVVGRVVARREPEEPFERTIVASARAVGFRAEWSVFPSLMAAVTSAGRARNRSWSRAGANGPARGVDEGVDADGVVRVAVQNGRAPCGCGRASGPCRPGPRNPPPPSHARGRAPCGLCVVRESGVLLKRFRRRASRRFDLCEWLWSCVGSVQAGSVQSSSFEQCLVGVVRVQMGGIGTVRIITRGPSTPRRRPCARRRGRCAPRPRRRRHPTPHSTPRPQIRTV